MSPDLVLATTNTGKIREIKQVLGHLPFNFLTKDVFSSWPQVEETGKTYLENALLKAHAVMDETGLSVLAEDSGLEVDALEGAPGIYSARFSGDDATDQKNNLKLISELADVPPDRRTAQYKCVAVVVFTDGRRVGAVGTCRGTISLEPEGSGGFGYDPYFIAAGQTRTMAELSPEEKNSISHRGKALRGLADRLEKVLGLQPQ